MEIKISKTGRVCAASEHAFEHGERVYSLIRLDNQTFVREDYGEQYWDPALAEGTVAVWSTRFIDPKVAEQQPPEVFSPLRRAFYEAAESDDRSVLAAAFLAAQLLRRQKVFRLIKESDDEEEARLTLYEDRIGNRLIEVRDPNLSYAELDAGRQRLLERLRELEAEPSEDTEAEGEETEEKADDTEQKEEQSIVTG